MSDTTIYFITPTDGDTSSSFVIQPKTIDGPVTGSIRQNTDLVLYGNGTENWGEKYNQNFYRLLENFACPPAVQGGVTPMRGTGTSTYGMVPGINNPVPGQMWYNTERQTMYFYTGTIWKATNDVNGSISVSQIDGINTTGASNGSVLRYQNGVWSPYTLPAYTNITSINDLPEFNAQPTSTGQILIWNGTEWIASNQTTQSVGWGDVTGSISANTTLTNALALKQNTITGAATTIAADDFVVKDRVLVSSASGKVAESSITSTQLSYLSGVTSNIQTQLNSKVSSASGTTIDSANLTGTPTAPTAIASTDSSQVATTAFVHDVGLGGHSQSYTYLAGCTITPTNRYLNTTYTNSSKSPIYIAVQLWPITAGTVSASLGIDLADPALYSVDQYVGYCANPFTVDPGNCNLFTLGSTSATNTITLQGIVPPGYRYRINTSNSIAGLHVHSWRELL